MTLLSFITFNYEINVTTIILGVAVAGGIPFFKTHWKKQKKNQQMISIKLDSIIDTVFVSANGTGEKLRMHYEKKKKELMEEQNFTDSE